MFDALKSLSPKQRFLGFIIVVFISATTSLGTAYMSGSDCTEVSDKYTKSIENYNKLIEITDETQQKYLDAKRDIILIQERLNQISEMMSRKDIKRESGTEYIDERVGNRGPASVEEDSVEKESSSVKTTSNWREPKKIIIKEKTTITKTVAPEGAKCMIDSLLQITKKYEKKK